MERWEPHIQIFRADGTKELHWPGTRKAKPMVHDIRFAVDFPNYENVNVILAYRHYRDGTIELWTYTEFILHGNGWDCIWTMEVANEVGP